RGRNGGDRPEPARPGEYAALTRAHRRTLLANAEHIVCCSAGVCFGTKRTFASASVDVRFSNRPSRVKHFQGYPPTPASMSLTCSRFSSDSAPRPFHHGIRRRGGTILWATLPSL